MRPWDQCIRIAYSFWTAKTQIWIDEVPIDFNRGKKKVNEFTDSSGGSHRISVYGAGLDYIPIINLDRQEFRLG